MAKKVEAEVYTGRRCKYSPEYGKLFTEFPLETLKPENVITFEAIAKVIEISQEDDRFNKIVNGWKNLLENNGVYAKKQEGGLVILTEEQKYGKSKKHFKRGVRAFAKSAKVAEDINLEQIDSSLKEDVLLLRRRASYAQIAAEVREKYEFRIS